MTFFEINCDGLIGPTHNYSGLAFGNVASANNAMSISRPREAALQGLKKMKTLHDLGMKQIVLPPHFRPDFATLRAAGFTGSEADIIDAVYKTNSDLLAHCYSASAMWSANAATVSPSPDTSDGKVHFTPANLISSLHRSLEAKTTSRILKAIFTGEGFAHHAPLPATGYFSDEGAANHTRLCPSYDKKGVELFVYGRDMNQPDIAPKKYPARQTLQACEAVARLHGLDAAKTVYARQHPGAIDHGVFHNDVIAVGNQNVLFYHEMAFADEGGVLEETAKKFGGGELYFIRVPSYDVPIGEAVKSYLFNSQLITLPEGNMVLIAPTECQESKPVKSYLDRLAADNANPIGSVQYLNVRESMKNGGGPACLRLRAVLNEAEWEGVHAGVKFSDALYAKLAAWVEKHYRETLAPADLADPKLAEESRMALEELTLLLGLPALCPFQDS